MTRFKFFAALTAPLAALFANTKSQAAGHRLGQHIWVVRNQYKNMDGILVEFVDIARSKEAIPTNVLDEQYQRYYHSSIYIRKEEIPMLRDQLNRMLEVE